MLNWRDIKNPAAGGAEIVVDNLIEGLRHGNDIVFFTSSYKGAAGHEGGSSVETIRRGSVFTVYVHAFLYLMQHRNEFDAVIESVSTVPFFTPLLFRKTSIIIPHHFMGRLVFRELPLHAAIAAYMAEKLIPLVYKRSKFVAVSNGVARELERMRISKQNIAIAHPCVSFRSEPLYRSIKAAKSPMPTVVTVSRLMCYKRVDMLIKIFSRVLERVEAKLVVVGSGKELGRLVALVKELRLQHYVEFKGAVSEVEKVRLLKEAWVFSTASSREGFGISALEAEKSALPVVAFGVGGIADVVKDGYSGFVVREGDADAYLSRLLGLLVSDAQRRQMSIGALAHSKQFRWNAISDTISLLLKKERNDKSLRRAQARR
ncbi:MAG: glycosyltransferase [Candidatus Micrarchaeia archaeon]